MPVNAISQSDNRKQNNIMAASAGIIAGTGGAIGGYSFAPRAVKNMDELLAPYIITGHYIGNRHTYNQCGDRCYHRYKNTSSQCGIIIFLCEKSDIVLKGKAVYLG